MLKAQVALAQADNDLIGAERDVITASDAIDRLLARTDGNALYVEELLAAALDGRGATPQSLRDAFMLRIERMSDPAGLAVRAVAVGRAMDESMITRLTGIESAALRDALREAVARWTTPAAVAPVAAPSKTPAGAAVDRSVLAQMFGDSPASITRVLGRFRDAGARMLGEIEAAMADPKQLHDLAHKLTGAARAAGAVHLGALAAALDQSSRSADIVPLQAEWQRVVAELNAA